MLTTVKDAQDAEQAGRSWLGFLRRNGPTFVANRWHDMSYAAGNPVANYYASTPGAAATLLGREGIDTGPAPASGMSKRLAVATLSPGTTGGSKVFWFADYCLYYPFVDGDGGLQALDNTVTMPRYGGAGCQVMAVCQGTGLATGGVRITYTNSAGVAGRQSTTTLDLTVTPGVLSSSLAAGVAHAAPGGPWMNLQHGDTGVRSIEDVEPLSAIGGIFALVIVKPLLVVGVPTATAAPVEVDSFADKTLTADFEPGAYIHTICHATAAGAPAVLGCTKTIWG